MSKIAEKVSLLITFSKESCTRDRYKENVADAPRVRMNPSTCFSLGISVESSPESELIARREADMVRRTTELNMNAVNFWEFRKKENTALKANWVAHSRE